MLALAVGGSAAVRDRAVQRELARLGASQTSIQAVWSGVPAQSAYSPRQLDREAKRALRGVTGRSPFAVILFRQARFGGAFVNLGAVDGLARWVKLRTGRLPRPCSAQRCELVRVGGSGALPRTPLLPVVGRGALAADAPLDAYFGVRGVVQPPVLLAEGVQGLAALPVHDADLIPRTFGWVLPVTPGSVHYWEISDLSQRVTAASAQLKARDSIFSLSAPLDQLTAIQARAGVAGDRLLVIGGDAAVLLAAFAVLAATRLRRETDAAWRRLEWFGARRSQLLTLSGAESGLTAAVSVVMGWALGSLGVILLARRLDTAAGPVLAHSVISGRGIALASALALTAAVVVLFALRARLRNVSVVDVAATGAAAAVLLALARGDANPGSVGGGTNVFLLVLPALALFVAAVIWARGFGPALAAAGRIAGRAPPVVRLAVLSLARRGAGPVLAAAFLVVSVGVAFFASAYRATLEQGQRDQAAFAAPADYILSEDLQRLVTVQHAASSYSRLGNSFDVLRAAGTVASGPALTLLALPASEVPRIGGWRSDFSPASREALARALTPHGTVAMRGLDLPEDARAVALPLTVRGGRIALALDVRNLRGDYSVISLGEPPAGRHVLTGRVPVAARGGRVVALRVALPLVASFLAGHRESGTTFSVSSESHGTLLLGRLRVDGEELPPFTGWIGTGGVRPGGGRLHYVVNRAAQSFFRPLQPTEDEAVPVVVTPRVARAAGPGGVLPLDVNNEPLTARVVAISRLVPSVDGEGVLADRDTVTTALNARRPGTGVPDEVWVLDPAPGAAQLVRARPFDLLAVESRRAVEHELVTDPLARGTLAILTLTSLVALLLALGGIVLSAVADRRDESGELFELRVQGASPRTLRAYLRLRALVVGVVGTTGGVLAGAALLWLVAGVVAVTAGGVEPVPPLVVGLDWTLLLAGLASLAVLATALVALATRERG
jgi:hypothetical protein